MKRIISMFLVLLIVFPVSCSKEAPLTPQPTMNEADYAPYDYSDHTYPGEERYTTILADTSAIKEGKPAIVKYEQESYWGAGSDSLNKKDEVFGYDVRSSNIADEDLSMVEDINDLSFDTDTVWPNKLPKGFDPDKILKYNKNPGLGIRALHKKKITGKGVSIAIIDQALLIEHEQYKDNIKLYERIHCSDDVTQMHAPAVASIAVGKDIGVAPKANLYFIASTFWHNTDSGSEFDASIIADTVLRILELNTMLDQEDKIRVISISKGYGRQDKGYDELQAAIKKADEANVFVLTTSTFEYYKDFVLFGMDRDYEQDPDEISSYGPVYWVEKEFYRNPDNFNNLLLFPVGSRTIAGCNGTDDYAIVHNGGLSWAVPWCAGLYALCCQVNPDITPREFIKAANETAITTELEYNGKAYSFGKIINPEGVIEIIKKK